MTTLWILAVLCIGATAVILFTSWRYRVDMAELGTVSQNWLSEHRASDRHYSEQ